MADRILVEDIRDDIGYLRLIHGGILVSRISAEEALKYIMHQRAVLKRVHSRLAALADSEPILAEVSERTLVIYVYLSRRELHAVAEQSAGKLPVLDTAYTAAEYILDRAQDIAVFFIGRKIRLQRKYIG